MIIAFANRHEFIELIGAGKVSTMVELGVYEGEFSDHESDMAFDARRLSQ
jgi:hypothetical protein